MGDVRSADDILDDGMFDDETFRNETSENVRFNREPEINIMSNTTNTTDEEDMILAGELLADELPPPSLRVTAPADEEEDEFAELMSSEEALPVIAGHPAVETSTHTQLVEITEEVHDIGDDLLDDLTLPTEEISIEETPEISGTSEILEDLEDLDLLDDLDSLEGLDIPTGTEVTAEEVIVEEVSEPEDMFEETGSGNLYKGLTNNQIRGRKAAETRRRNSDAASSKTSEAEDDVQEGIFSVPEVKVPHESESVPGDPIKFTPVEAHYEDLSAGDMESVALTPFFTKDSAIDRALAKEAEQYSDITERDLYFYRLGVSKGMRHKHLARFVDAPE